MNPVERIIAAYKIKQFVYLLARNARQAKRCLRRHKRSNDSPVRMLMFLEGQENEAWNRLQGAKEFFSDELKIAGKLYIRKPIKK